MAVSKPLLTEFGIQHRLESCVSVTTMFTISDKAPTMEISKSEYEALLDRFTSAEKRVSHLNSLLSEAETESQRMSQLAEVLKEEIRTYQRSEERSKHIENLEYVKNVIIKVRLCPRFSL